MAALEAGAPAIQLRDKDASADELFRQATRLRELTRAHDALLFINDRLDVALAADADGVHLGPDDLPVPPARMAARRVGRTRISPPRPAGTDAEIRERDEPDRPGHPFLIGYSTDDPDTARLAAREGADYIGCGAVFGTRTKDLGDERIGTDGLAAVAGAVDVPVVGIGGVTTHNVAALPATGAAGAAVIGGVMKAEDIGAAVRALLEPWG